MFYQRQRKAQRKSKAKEDAPAHVFCAKASTGPAIVLHIMVAKASVLFRPAKVLPFRQAYLEGDQNDWITGAGAFTVSVPSMQNFASFDLDGVVECRRSRPRLVVKSRPFQKEIRRHSPQAFSTACISNESLFAHTSSKSFLLNWRHKSSTFVMLERFRLCPFPRDGGFRCTSATVDNPRSFLC